MSASPTNSPKLAPTTEEKDIVKDSDVATTPVKASETTTATTPTTSTSTNTITTPATSTAPTTTTPATSTAPTTTPTTTTETVTTTTPITATITTSITDPSDNYPLDIERVAKHLGYPPPPEFESLPVDFYKDLQNGYPDTDGKDPETDIDAEIYCFYLAYFVKYPVLLYASAYSRESDRFSRKVSWDIYSKYGKVFYGFISSARMRKTLLQKLNRYRKKSAKASQKLLMEAKEGSVNSDGGSSNNNNSSNSNTRLRRAAPERKKEKELMDQILRLHDRIIDTAIDSGASKRPHKNSKDQAHFTATEGSINASSYNGKDSSGAVATTHSTGDNENDHLEETSNSSLSDKVKLSRRESAVSTSSTPLSPSTNITTGGVTSAVQKSDKVERVGPPSLTTASNDRQSVDGTGTSNHNDSNSHKHHPVVTPQKRSWRAVNDIDGFDTMKGTSGRHTLTPLLPSRLVYTHNNGDNNNSNSHSNNNTSNNDRKPTIQKLIHNSDSSPPHAQSSPTHHNKPITPPRDPPLLLPQHSALFKLSSTASNLSEVLEHMTEIKKCDAEMSIALDSINTDVQMLVDQIDYIRHNLEMTVELARKTREDHGGLLAKITKLLDK